MSLINLIKERKSVRNYKRKKIPDEKIYDILRIGRLAPSGANRQPWLYIIVKDQKIKKLIRTECEKVDEIWHRNAPQSIRAWLKKQNITSEKRFLTDAPVLLCVFGDKRAPYWLESTWISISYITLAIVEQNLGTITYTPGDPSFLNEILEVPDNFVPLAILPVGIPEETKIRKTTKKIRYNNRIFINRYVKEKNHKKEKKRNEISYKIPALDENNQKIKRCACGCGQPIVSLVRSRIFIPGHSKFGKNGILKILKNPPKCKCGCGNPVSWNWEEMKWNKYHDESHEKNKLTKMSKIKVDQIEIFK